MYFNFSRYRIFILLFFSVGIYAFTAPLYADELILKNGDRLTGKVLNQAGGVLKFKTSYAGILTIKWSEVSEIRSDEPMILLLEEDKVLTAHVVKNTGDRLRIENMGTEDVRELAKSSLKEISPEPWLLGHGYKFSGLINASLEFDRGNNVNDEIDLDGKLEYRRLYHRLSLLSQYEKRRTEGVTTKLKWMAVAAYDFFPKKQWDYVFDAQDWYVGLGLNLKKDEFADLKLRTRVGPHVGYQFYESKAINLFVRSGIEVVNEEYSDGEVNRYLASAWRINFDKYFYRDKLQFYFISDGLYGFDSPNKIILDEWVGFRVPLSAGFVASVEVEADYDSQPAEDVEKISAFYRFKLGYRF